MQISQPRNEVPLTTTKKNSHSVKHVAVDVSFLFLWEMYLPEVPLTKEEYTCMSNVALYVKLYVSVGSVFAVKYVFIEIVSKAEE